jgi:hypothetical protein
MGHGADTADPHPTALPEGTEICRWMPSGSPGRFSRIATTLLYPVARAKPSAAQESVLLVSDITRLAE